MALNRRSETFQIGTSLGPELLNILLCLCGLLGQLHFVGTSSLAISLTAAPKTIGETRFRVFNQTKKMEEAELDIIKLQKIRPSKQHLIVFHCCSAFAQHLKHRIFQPCSASTALAAAMALAAKSAASLWALVNSNCTKYLKISQNIYLKILKASRSAT